MEKNKPLLSTLFFIGLSFWGIQLTQAATADNDPKAVTLMNAALPDLPSAYTAQAPDNGLQDFALTLFHQVKSSAAISFQQALSSFGRVGDVAEQAGWLGLLGMVFEPVIDDAKIQDLRAALPTTAWLFLSGILGFLGLKKRHASVKYR